MIGLHCHHAGLVIHLTVSDSPAFFVVKKQVTSPLQGFVCANVLYPPEVLRIL
jgi:hypothetical protein